MDLPLLGFLLGVALGLAIGLWRWYRLERKLRLLARGATAGGSGSELASQLSRTINDQLLQMQLLRQQIQDLERMLDASPTGFLQVDEENRLLWCNAQAAQLLGIAPTMQAEEPRLLLELVRSFELDALIEDTRQLQQPGQRDWLLHRVSPDPFHPRNEPTFPLRGYGIPLGQGKVAVFLENRQEAETLIQQRDRWTSDVAHELKTPLTSIRLVAETLKPRVDSSLQGWLDRMLNEAIRLSNLVEDLLNLSRLDGETCEGLNLVPIDLPPMVQLAWQSLEPLARIKHLSLDYSGPQELVITLDQGLFHRVLINLLDNAIKHSPPRSAVYVRLSVLAAGEPAGGQVLLEVIDLGEGFQEKDLPYIFERFYRADLARQRQEGPLSPSQESPQSGTGLGLAIVKQIIQTHQGRVEALNHPKLGGGWLKLYLPGHLLVERAAAFPDMPDI